MPIFSQPSRSGRTVADHGLCTDPERRDERGRYSAAAARPFRGALVRNVCPTGADICPAGSADTWPKLLDGSSSRTNRSSPKKQIRVRQSTRLRRPGCASTLYVCAGSNRRQASMARPRARMAPACLDDAIGRVRRQVVAVCEDRHCPRHDVFLSSLLVRHSMPQPSTDWTLPSILVLETPRFLTRALHQLVPRLDERLAAFLLKLGGEGVGINAALANFASHLPPPRSGTAEVAPSSRSLPSGH